jgi:hypothetical protein
MFGQRRMLHACAAIMKNVEGDRTSSFECTASSGPRYRSISACSAYRFEVLYGVSNCHMVRKCHLFIRSVWEIDACCWDSSCVHSRAPLRTPFAEASRR